MWEVLSSLKNVGSEFDWPVLIAVLTINHPRKRDFIKGLVVEDDLNIIIGFDDPVKKRARRGWTKDLWWWLDTRRTTMVRNPNSLKLKYLKGFEFNRSAQQKI